MKLIISILCAISLVGCVSGRFRGPAGDYYQTHSRHGASLFKMKSPQPYWYTNRGKIFKSAGTDEPIEFNGRGVPKPREWVNGKGWKGGGFDEESTDIHLSEAYTQNLTMGKRKVDMNIITKL